MANEKNLIPTNQRSKSEVRAIGKKGGIASGKARRGYRQLREIAQEQLTEVVNTKNGGSRTIGEGVVRALIKKSTEGDTKAINLLARILGELTNNIDLTSNGEALQLNIKVSTPEIGRAIEEL